MLCFVLCCPALPAGYDRGYGGYDQRAYGGGYDQRGGYGGESYAPAQHRQAAVGASGGSYSSAAAGERRPRLRPGPPAWPEGRRRACVFLRLPAPLRALPVIFGVHLAGCLEQQSL